MDKLCVSNLHYQSDCVTLIIRSPGQKAFPVFPVFPVWRWLPLCSHLVSDEIVLQPEIVFVKINPCVSQKTAGAPWENVCPSCVSCWWQKQCQIPFRFIYMTKCTATPHVSQGECKTCDRAGLAFGGWIMDCAGQQYRVTKMVQIKHQCGKYSVVVFLLSW